MKMFYYKTDNKTGKFNHLQFGLSLVEVLIVISCILFLIAFIPLFLRPARVGSRMGALCPSRIKWLMIGIFTYADEHNYRPPFLTNSNNLNEISKDTSRLLLRNMGIDVNSAQFKENDIVYSSFFYCPANVQQKRNITKLWNFSKNIRIAGYFFLIDTKTGRPKIQGTDSQLKQWVTRLDMPKQSEKEMITDIIISDQINFKPPQYPNGNFEKIQSTILGRSGFESTNHLINDAKPAGGNIGFIDGHVEWRPFNEMEKRYGDYPVCWW